ncbi:MAG: hypothetical protein KDA42_09375 [Planctomycetales bacterium]|nr:hypothetical protein [Planctomycetales bacterium]
MFRHIAQHERLLHACLAIATIAALALGAGPVGASLISATTTNFSGQQWLTSVTVNRNEPTPSTFSGNSLIDVDVNHWHSTDSGSNALAVGGVDPGAGNRASLIDGDRAVNTGLVNPGEQPALSIAQQATVGPANSTLNGLGVTFAGGGLVNYPGDDVVVFVYSQTGIPDGFLVSRVDGTLGSLMIASGDYTTSFAGLTTGIINSTPTSLNAFESGGWTVSSTSHTQPVFGVAFDLDDLGYLPLEVVSGLFFTDAPGDQNVNFTLIRGLPLTVPEPATLSYFGLSVVGLISLRRTGRSRNFSTSCPSGHMNTLFGELS